MSEQTVAAIQEKGGRAIAVSADVSKAAQVESMVRQTVQTYGQLDILFNNAGVMQPLKTTVETSEEDWDRVMDINLKGTFLAKEQFLKLQKL